MKKILYLIVLLPIMVIGQTTSENYIKSTTYRDSLLQKPVVNITYFDGLGRPIQQIIHQQSGTGKDIITPITYDEFGRQTKEYLPYTKWYGISDMSYISSSASDVLAYYSTTDSSVTGNPNFDTTTNPFSEKLIEASPLNRVLKQAAPGNAWALPTNQSDPDHTIKFDYLTNVEHEVKLYTAIATWNPTNKIYNVAFGENGSNDYQPNQLYKTIIKDENWESGTDHTIEEFKDKEGRVILKRTYGVSIVGNVPINTEHDTYYVYDQYGNLTYVIPPLVTDVCNQLDDLCYQYKYDYRNRLVEKKLPSKQWEYIVYDKLDRIVATGPVFTPFGGNQTGWMVTCYDAFNRTVYTGWLPKSSIDTTSRKQMQDHNDQLTVFNEERVNSNIINDITVGYTSNYYMASSADFILLTVNYYDDYSFPNAQAVPQTEIYNQRVALNTKGLTTGSWIRILDSSFVNSELTTTFYDYLKFRPILSYTSNYLSGFTEIKNKYAFDGLVLLTETNHKRDTHDNAIRILEEFEYSEQGRLINHFHTINNLTKELITHNEYDELGQLISKNVGGQDNTGATGLQKVNYQYNIRGWLTDINNVANLNGNAGDPIDLFAFKINYNEPQLSDNEQTYPLYNGNISQTFWRTAADDIKRKYGYRYDSLNRLSNATYMRSNYIYNSYDETLSYDKNGNITSLIRNGNLESLSDAPIEIDNLTYTYPDNSNQLSAVRDNTNDPMGFKDNNNGDNTDYSYDSNGNMTGDDNKGIELIVYNHLNLPTFIDFGALGSISYLYDATGRKVRKTVANSSINVITDYMNGFQYENEKMMFFPHAEGFVNVTYCETCHGSFENTVRYSYAYNYTDHLGNIRLTYGYDEDNQEVKILEENHYYPFGLKHSSYNTERGKYDFSEDGDGAIKVVQVPSADRLPYKYKYNGKELQDELGLNMYDMDARNYMPDIGRWGNMDKLSEAFKDFSPYNFANDNPIIFSDPTGLSPIKYQNEETNSSELNINSSNDFTSTFVKRGVIVEHRDDGDSNIYEVDDSWVVGGSKKGLKVVGQEMPLISYTVGFRIVFLGNGSYYMRNTDQSIKPIGGTGDLLGVWDILGKASEESDLDLGLMLFILTKGKKGKVTTSLTFGKKPLPSIDATGKVHGDLPSVKDFPNYSIDELKILLSELKQSVQKRIQVTTILGKDRAHGKRQGAEQDLVKSLEKYITDK